MGRVVWAHHDEATPVTTVHQGPVTEMVTRRSRYYPRRPRPSKPLPRHHPRQEDRHQDQPACGVVPTHPGVVSAIIEGLRSGPGQSTPPPENIIVHDSTRPSSAREPDTMNWSGDAYVGADHPSIGFDMTHTCTISYPGGSTNHHVSRIIGQF
jgi:hypothetical protein